MQGRPIKSKPLMN